MTETAAPFSTILQDTNPLTGFPSSLAVNERLPTCGFWNPRTRRRSPACRRSSAQVGECRLQRRLNVGGAWLFRRKGFAGRGRRQDAVPREGIADRGGGIGTCKRIDGLRRVQGIGHGHDALQRITSLPGCQDESVPFRTDREIILAVLACERANKLSSRFVRFQWKLLRSHSGSRRCTHRCRRPLSQPRAYPPGTSRRNPPWQRQVTNQA